MIDILRNAASKGLDPEDYDGSRWMSRLQELSADWRALPESRLTTLDLALTVSVMRYASDLHFGRLNPGTFHWLAGKGPETFDLPKIVRELAREDQSQTIATLEPPYPGYKQTEQALRSYLVLKAGGEGESLPTTRLPLEPGSFYAGSGQLANLLRKLGDLPANSITMEDQYQGALVDAVKRFQWRHGLDIDGRIGKETLYELNVPIDKRIRQLSLALERWRWVPHSFSKPPIVINIPEFRLRAFDKSYHTELEMKIIAGQAIRHETPVFAALLQYVTFRPFWHVPFSIAQKELIPEILRDPGYMPRHGYEVVNGKDEFVTGTMDAEILPGVRSGKYSLRQIPGDQNSLGLIAFGFPNEHQVYMHATPATTLFQKSRRDFSHGCIRLEKPIELAEWVLKDDLTWTRQKIVDAMHGSQTLQVNLKNQIPVLIVYATAVALASGDVLFLRDVYGQDARLEGELAKGHPRSSSRTSILQ